MIWSRSIDVWFLWYFEYYRYSYGPESGQILPWIFVVFTICITIHYNMDIGLGSNGSFNVLFTIWLTIHYNIEIDLGFNGSFKSSDNYIFVEVWTGLDLRVSWYGHFGKLWYVFKT